MDEKFLITDSTDKDRAVLTTAEAAELTGISAVTIRKMCKTGHVKYVEAGRGWLVNRASLLRFLGEEAVEKKPTVSDSVNPKIVLTCAEAARMIGVTEQTVRLMCKRGELKNRNISGNFYINRRAFMLYFGEDFFHTEFDASGRNREDCYCVPKAVFSLMREKKLSANAVMIYAMFAYRIENRQKALYDENDNPYIILPATEVAKALGISQSTAVNELDSLESAGLICRKQRRIYVLKPGKKEL